MLTLDAPVLVSTVPLASAANVFTTQLDTNPLTATGGPKKQLASAAHPPARPAHSTSVVQETVGSLTQCRLASGPREQSLGPVPKLAVSVIPSSELRIEAAFSGIWDAGTCACPPPM